MAYLTKANCKEIILIEDYDKSESNSNTNLYIGIVLLLLIIFLGFSLYNRRKSK